MLFFLCTAILSYGLIVVGMTLYQDHLVFHNTRQTIFDHAPPVPFSVVSVTTTDGLTLNGYYAAPAPGKPVIVYFHGNAGYAGDRLYKTAEPLKEGYGFLLTEYRGYGGNPGAPSETGLYQDARAWIAFLKHQNITDDQMIYYGESLGTGVAVQMAKDTPPRAVILEAPFTSVPDVGAFYYPFLPVRLVAKHHFDSRSKASVLTMPVLIMHGTRDLTVPQRFGKQLFAAIPDGHKMFVSIPKAGHANVYDYGAAAIIMDFLHQHAP